MTTCRKRFLRRARSLFLWLAFFPAGLVFPAPASSAEPWPQKPIRLVAPVGAGSGADLVARTLAERLAERLRQPVVVDNRPGAAANIGPEVVSRAAPDGYTFLYALTNLAINPHLYRLSFDPLKDFVPVALIARYQFVLLARPAFPAQNLKDVLALAGARPGALKCGYSSGNFHIGCALLGALGDVDVLLVPYKSAPQIMADLLTGRIDLSFEAINNAAGHVAARGAIPIAMTSRRQPRGPLGNLPAAGETLKGFDLASWQGIAAPVGTPREIIRQFSEEIQAVLAEPGIRSRLESWGMEVSNGTPAALSEMMARDYKRYEVMIQRAGIRVER